MPWDPYSQNSNETRNNPYTTGGYEKAKLKKLLLIMLGVIAAIVIVVLVVHFSQSNSQQSKYIRSATEAARKITPDAKVTNVKVAGGFASAGVSSPVAGGDALMTFFKVNKDGSMKQLVSGSSVDQIYLLELGIPLATQAQLTGSSTEALKQSLASECNYNGGSAPGYVGFGGSFGPNGLQIDAGTINGLERTLSDTISNQNTKASPGKMIICVAATQKNSTFATDPKTYINTITLQALFITADGTLTTHSLTLASGPNLYHSYTLDGQALQ